MRAALFEYFATSSMAIVSPRMPAPEPPYSSGMHNPRRPASRNTANRSSGYSPVSSISRPAARPCPAPAVGPIPGALSALRKGQNPRRKATRLAGRAEECLGSLATLTEDAAPLAVGEATPDALPLAHGQSMLEARLTHRANLAYSFGLPGLLIRRRVKDVGVETPASTSLSPCGFHADSLSLVRAAATTLAHSMGGNLGSLVEP